MNDDFEQEIRDALHRTDSIVVPIRPLDPEEIAARAPKSHRATLRDGTTRRLLALAACVALVAGVGLAAWSWLGRSDAVPAAPSPGTEYGVEVDISSGQGNPELTLDPSIGRELYLMLDDIRAAGLLKPSDPPSFGLEFRGFVVTPSDNSLSVLRILPKTVYSIRGGGSYEQLEDPEEEFYTRVYHALRPQLPDVVPEARATTTPTMPNVTASMPPKLGDTATWTLAEPDSVGAATTQLTLNVTRLGCAGGKTGTVLDPTVSFSDTQVIIRANVQRLTGLGRCPLNKPVRVVLILSEPLGDRDLLDAACLEGDALGTRPCSTGAIRRTP